MAAGVEVGKEEVEDKVKAGREEMKTKVLEFTNVMIGTVPEPMNIGLVSGLEKGGVSGAKDKVKENGRQPSGQITRRTRGNYVCWGSPKHW